MAKILSWNNCKLVQGQRNFPKRLYNTLLRLKYINNVTIESMKRETSDHYYCKNFFLKHTHGLPANTVVRQ